MVIELDSRKRTALLGTMKQAVNGRGRTGDELVVRVTSEEEANFIRRVAWQAGYRALCAMGVDTHICILKRAG